MNIQRSTTRLCFVLSAVCLLGGMLDLSGADALAMPSYHSSVRTLDVTQNSSAPTVAPRLTGGLIIVPDFTDPALSADPRAADIKATINAALAVYHATFTDNVTVNVTFQKVSTGLAHTSHLAIHVTYQQFHTNLLAKATSADDLLALSTLPNAMMEPVTGGTDVLLLTPLARCLGFAATPPTGVPDCTIQLNTTDMNLTSADTDPAKYSLFTAVSHELDEVLGFVSALTGSVNGDALPSYIEPVDLFRYDGNGKRSFSTSASDTAWFSIDGTTNLVQFNQYSPSSGKTADFHDWLSAPAYPAFTPLPRVQDAYGTPGATPTLAEEVRMLDIIGWTRASAESTTLTVDTDTETFNEKSQTIVLSGSLVAQFADTVSDGMFTVQVYDANFAPVGGPAETFSVVANIAAVQYVLPAGTPAGTYTIYAAYNGGTQFLPSTNFGALTVNPNQTTTVAAAGGTVEYSLADQSVPLSATVTGYYGSPVNEGTVFFLLLDSTNNPIGMIAQSGTVMTGMASVQYIVPGFTPPGQYTLVATYQATNNFVNSSDGAQMLTVTTSVQVFPSTYHENYSATDQTVQFFAYTVSIDGATVDEGTLTFQVVSTVGGLVGNPVTANVDASGEATVDYVLPSGTLPGTYSLHADYNGPAYLGGSVTNGVPLVIGTAPVTVTAASAVAPVSATDQTVQLFATVTSASGGTVNEGTVTFSVILMSFYTPIGDAVTSPTVVSGATSVSYLLPKGTAAGTYLIEAHYTGTGIFSEGYDDSQTLTLSGTALTITSGPTATPDPTIPYQDISFFVAASATGGLIYDWNFGDGTAVEVVDSGSVTYHYQVAGEYTVGVTVKDPSSGATANGTVPVTISALPVAISKVSIVVDLSENKLGIPNDKSNQISFTATLPAPTTNFNPKTATASMNVGGVSGSGVKVTLKKGIVTCVVNLKGAGYAATLATSGLTNNTLTGKPVSLYFTLFINGTAYQAVKTLTYTAKQNSKGKASAK